MSESRGGPSFKASKGEAVPRVRGTAIPWQRRRWGGIGFPGG
ncbi:MAG: hypothetical protein PVH58_15210 [Desulfobacterales bacterium]